MNPVTKTCAICATAIGLLILGTLMVGPVDVEYEIPASHELQALELTA